jgi:hypothetical protein
MPLREQHLAAPGVELLLRSGLDALSSMMSAAAEATAATTHDAAAAGDEQAGSEGAKAPHEVVFVTLDTTLREALQARNNALAGTAHRIATRCTFPRSVLFVPHASVSLAAHAVYTHARAPRADAIQAPPAVGAGAGARPGRGGRGRGLV